MAPARAVRLVFVCKVLPNLPLGVMAILCSAARANLAGSVSNNPNCSLAECAVGVSFLGTEPESDSFGWTRHSDLMRSIAASVDLFIHEKSTFPTLVDFKIGKVPHLPSAGWTPWRCFAVYDLNQ